MASIPYGRGDFPDTSTSNTPLPPSVEKAYYRKCIELKRRLNEVEAANDELKIRKARQERGVLKMRLQRAYLLDHLRKMMEHTSAVEGSEASGDEVTTTEQPQVDRPHRDKRRRQQQPPLPGPPPMANSHAHQSAPYGPPSVPRLPSQPEPGGTPMMMPPAGGYSYPSPYQQHTPSAPPHVPGYPHTAPIPASPYGPPPPDHRSNGSVPNGADDRARAREPPSASRSMGTSGENMAAADVFVQEHPEGANAASSQRPEMGTSEATPAWKAVNR